MDEDKKEEDLGEEYGEEEMEDEEGEIGEVGEDEQGE
jgi:hypothetical protein